MPLFTKVIFLFLSGSFVLKLLCVLILPYPRMDTERWHDIIDLIIMAPFIAWAFYLL